MGIKNYVALAAPFERDTREIYEESWEMTNPASNRIDHKSIHERWMSKRNRKVEVSGYKDEWWREQCLHCNHYVPLEGPLGDDYGACSNPASPFDHSVMFEHDGCERYEQGKP